MKFIIFTALLCGCAAVPLSFKDCVIDGTVPSVQPHSCPYVSSCALTNFDFSGSVGAKISSVSVPECEADPCVLHHGTNYTVTVDFNALENSATAKTVVHGIIGGVPVPFPVPSDCCNNHQLKCPIVNGAAGTYTNSIYCSPEYPKIKLLVKWEVMDDNQKDFFCFVVPLEIQS